MELFPMTLAALCHSLDICCGISTNTLCCEGNRGRSPIRRQGDSGNGKYRRPYSSL